MLIDTHAHLWFDDFENDLDIVLTRAREAGVEKMIVPGTDIESSKKAIKIAKRYPGVLYVAVGIHPEEVLGANSNEETPFSCRRALLDLQSGIPFRESPREIVAIGEIGTDASTDELRACMEAQKKLFREQCDLALEYDLPVIIHTRNSLNEALQVLDELPKMPKGQFHCFSHDEIGLKLVLERGFYVSFAGNITWSKRVSKLVALVPDDRLLLETDSPFMTPRIDGRVAPSSLTREQPSEAQNRNEPMNVRVLAVKIAEIRGQNLLEVEKFTTDNVMRLFRL